MKKTGLLVLLLATAAWAQTETLGGSVEAPQGTATTTNSFPGERIQTPTYSDLYCAGFISKQTLSFHAPVRFDRYLPASSKVSGRIVMGKDFDSQLGTGNKVYLNVGANQGVKIGDYFRAVRTYETDLKDPVDSLSFKAAIAEDTQKKSPSVDPNLFEPRGNGPVIHVRDLPRRAVGEIVILGVTNTTATGMIVYAMEDVHAGDNVELDTLN